MTDSFEGMTLRRSDEYQERTVAGTIPREKSDLLLVLSDFSIEMFVIELRRIRNPRDSFHF